MLSMLLIHKGTSQVCVDQATEGEERSKQVRGEEGVQKEGRPEHIVRLPPVTLVRKGRSDELEHQTLLSLRSCILYCGSLPAKRHVHPQPWYL